ncbi:MAG: PAS domain-containing protein [Candidatus Sabulitectum sp.]|nr:PAS domain-containing protein [Candidatus Sabulitectum sp.]
MAAGSVRFSESRLFLLLSVLLIAVLSGSTAIAIPAVHESNIPCVLILHSYHPGFIWTENISNGLHSVLDEADFEMNIHTEYMDTKVYTPEDMFPLLEQLYRDKYEGDHFDLVITTDDTALNFLLLHRDLLFPGVPVVFCGLNSYTESRIESFGGITGVAEAMDIAGTIELALKLHPGTRYVAVVNDSTPTGIWNLENFRNTVPVFAGRIEFIELLNLTTEELTESLNELPDETVVLLLSFYRDQAGRTFNYREYTMLVTENCGVPVYTAWDMFVGHGVIGGVVTSGKAQGEHAALLALRVLNGESPDDIPVITESPNVPMFDYDVMQRYGVSVADLPDGRVVLNEPVSLYYQHKTLFWMAMAFVLLQSATILALTVNVLRRRRAEGSLRQSEERYRGIVEDQTELICRNLPDGTLTFVNDAYCRYFDRSRDELLGQSFFSLIPEEYHQAVTGYFASLGRENTVATHEYRIVMPDGESRWNQWTNRAILDDDGQVVEFQGTGCDITERKMAEKELQKAEKRYRTLVEQMPAVTYIATLNEISTTTFISPQIKAFLGVSPQVYKDNPDYWAQHLHPDDRDRVLEQVANCHETGVPFLSEYRMISKAGDTVWFRDEAVIVKSDEGTPLFLQGVMTNITERKCAEQEQLNLERQVLHAQKLESLGVLAGGIAHDFNNLLTGILGNADLALFDLPAESPARQNIQDIETAASRAAELCYQMLAYSGKGHSVIESTNLSEIVQEMSHILEVSIRKKAVLKYKLANDPVIIMADATQIRQVIMNLITNASDAIGDMNGVISISTGFVQYDNFHLHETYADENLLEGMYAFLEVTDTGCGMDNSTKQRLFDPFFSTKIDGRGLGLSAVQGIVRGHKGVLRVYSEPGTGTTFRILLPVSDKSIKVVVKVNDEQTDWNGHGTVLLADDEETVRKIGKHMLERLGLSVILAVDGEEAVEIFRVRHDEIDCVLLDLTMPRMDGEEALQEMQRIRKDVRVVLSSGYCWQEISERFAGKGLISFIPKPYVMKVLQKAVREAIESKTK